jgi:hypothetical protein
VNKTILPALVMSVAMLVAAGCATPKKGAEHKPKWDVATEKEVSAALDRAVIDATKGWVKLKKDGVLMFCKRHRQIGSNLPSITCLTEAEVRVQVQNMQKYRDDMRQRSGRCPMGPGCRSDGGPNAAGN